MSVTDTATDRSKKYKSPGTVQIAAEITQAGRQILYSESHNFINSVKVFYLPSDAQ
jgi:hypothetical protein